MRYVGGKSRIARPISEILIAAGAGRSTYVEPFLGGASVFSKVAPHFPRAIGADVVEDLVLMWRAACAGWVPPCEVSEDAYRAQRTAPPSALRGFVGFGCSFGGKWFGGYARGGTRNFADEASRRIVATATGGSGHRAAGDMTRADLRLCDFRDLSPEITSDTIVYCDPPYAGTTGYDAAAPWDAAEFWKVAEEWAARGALVFMSEYAAPEPWRPVWERAHRQSLQGGAKPRPATVERLWALPATIEAAGLSV